MPQSRTAYQPTVKRRRAKEHEQPQTIRKTIKVKQPTLSVPRQDDCITIKDTKYCITKQGPNTDPLHNIEQQ